MRLYFNADLLPELKGEYIAWCDGMGTGQALGSSLPRAANYIFKLHRAFSDALAALPNGHTVRIYPLMDGMYLTTPNRRHFQQVLRDAVSALALDFINTEVFYHRFMIRGGITFGATMHGSDIDEGAFVRGIGTSMEQVIEDLSKSLLSTSPGSNYCLGVECCRPIEPNPSRHLSGSSLMIPR